MSIAELLEKGAEAYNSDIELEKDSHEVPSWEKYSWDWHPWQGTLVIRDSSDQLTREYIASSGVDETINSGSPQLYLTGTRENGELDFPHYIVGTERSKEGVKEGLEAVMRELVL